MITKQYFMSTPTSEVKSESEWISDWHYRDLDDYRQFDQFWEDQQLVEVEQYITQTKSGKNTIKWKEKE